MAKGDALSIRIQLAHSVLTLLLHREMIVFIELLSWAGISPSTNHPLLFAQISVLVDDDDLCSAHEHTPLRRTTTPVDEGLGNEDNFN